MVIPTNLEWMDRCSSYLLPNKIFLWQLTRLCSTLFFYALTKNKVDNFLRKDLNQFTLSCIILKSGIKFYGSHRKIWNCVWFSSYIITKWKVWKYGVISGPCFPVFGLNTEIYEVNLRIQSKYRKIRTKKHSLFGHFSRSVWCWEWVLPTDSHVYLAAYKL